MSLYDEAKLALLPGGEAGKHGKIYNAKPVVEKLGVEQAIDGQFSNYQNWTTNVGVADGGFSISGNGKATSNGAQSADVLLHNPDKNFLKVKTTYRIKFDLVDVTSGSIYVKVGNGGTVANGGRSDSFHLNGTYSVDLAPDSISNFPAFQFVGDANFTGSIANVSCKEVLSRPEDFKVSRGTDTAVSRVIDSNIIETQARNLVQWSNRADLWTPNPSYYDTPTTGHLGYNGSNDAWLINKTHPTSNSYVSHGRVIDGTNAFSWSMYAKMVTAPVLLMYSPAFAMSFDLENGTILGTTSTSIVGGNAGNSNWQTFGKIEDVGNGWYRCTTTGYGTVTSGLYSASVGNDSFRFQPRTRNAANTNDLPTAGSMYVMNMQVEYGLDSTEFIHTAGKKNLLMDSSRLHCSEWVKSSGVQDVKQNVKGYDGTSNAYELIRNGQYARLEQNYKRYWGQQLASVYAKASTAPYMTLRLDRLDDDDYSTIDATHLATFDLENGVVVSNSGGSINNANIEDAGNGWWRCSIQGYFGTDIFRIYPSQSTSPYPASTILVPKVYTYKILSLKRELVLERTGFHHL